MRVEAKILERFFEWIDETQFELANNNNQCCPAGRFLLR
jgi:hypothetical protein